MRIAVVGGTGMLGKQVVKELQSHGHEVRVLSRNSPFYRIDLATGEGLQEALKGCSAVVDASNAMSRAADILVEGTRKLLAAEEAAGVGHHVCVSIVGCERIPVGYYRVKAEQERVVEQGRVPWSLIRATQFHEFVAALFEQAGRWRVMPLLRIPLQTVTVAEVARTVADIAVGNPLNGRLEIAGPEIIDAREMARAWRSATGKKGIPLPIPLPGKLGRILRSGAATEQRAEVQGVTRFQTWLEAQGRQP